VQVCMQMGFVGEYYIGKMFYQMEIFL